MFDHEKYERMLAESEERYQALVDLSRNAIVFQQQGKLVYLNQSALQLLHAKLPSEIVGKSIVDYIDPGCKAPGMEHIRRLEEPGQHLSPTALIIRRLDGQSGKIEVTSTPIMYQGKPAAQILIKDITAGNITDTIMGLQADVLSQVTDAVVVVDTRQIIQFWNKGAERLYEYSAAEVLGRRLDEINPYCWNEPGQQSSACSALNTEGFWRCEGIHFTKSGKKLYVQSSVSTLKDESGQSIGMVAVTHDVTEYRQSEEGLRESEQRYRSLVESSPEAILVHQDNRCVYVNPAGLELLGAENFEDIKEKELNHFIHPDFRNAAGDWLREIAEKGALAPSLELKILRLNGHEVNAEAVGTLITFGGKPATQLIVKDISERKNTELRLRLQATVLSQVNDAVVAIGKEGRIIFWNKGAERLYKMPVEEVIGRKREDVYRYRFLTPFDEKAAKESMATNGFVRGETIHVLKSGEEIYVESSVSVLTDWSNAPVGWLAVMRDVTERKTFERKLRDSEQLYRMMFESNPHPMWIYDTDTLRFLFVNDAAVARYGYSKEEFLSMTIKDIRPVEDREVLFDNTLKIATGLYDEGNWRHRKKDGSIIDVEIISHNLKIQGKDARVVLAHDVTERKQAEHALRESEERQRTVFDNSPIAIIAKDLQGRHILFNRQAEVWMSIKREDALGKTAYDLLPQNEADLCTGGDRKVIETRAPVQSEENIRFADGIHTHLTVKFPLFDSASSLYAVCSIMSDITEMKRAEQAIKEARDAALRDRNKLEIILNTIPSGVFVTEGPDGVITHQNDQVSRVLGRSIDSRGSVDDRIVEFEMSTSQGTLFKPGELPNVRALNGEDVRDAEITLRRPDGKKVTMLANAAPLRDADGNIFASVTAFNDITQRKEAEDALKRARNELELRVRERTAELAATVAALQSEIAERKRTVAERDKLVAAVESTAEAIVVTDNRGIIQYVNPSFEEITGYSRQEAIGRDIHFLDSGQHDKDFFPAMRETIRVNGVWKGRLINKKKDGTIYYEDCTYSPVKDRSGNIVNYVSIKHDVTDRLRLESIAETVDAMNNIGYVFSGIRHEIGNPVSSLLIILSLLKKKYETSPKEMIKEYMDQAINQVERIEYLLKSLKNFNMYENLQIRNIEVSSFLEKFIPLVSADLTKKGVALQVEPVPEDSWMAIDSRALQQALVNVVVNASDAVSGRADPRITMGTRKAGGMVHIRVSDNGTGIPEDRKKDLFKPFYTTKSDGTGLGLVITRKLISRMKGFIEITSRADEGTIVDIYLPEGTVERAV